MPLTFVTHADVVVDPNVPVPDWHLSLHGLTRHRTHADRLRRDGHTFDALWSSTERKAMDAAAILSDVLGLTAQTNPGLCENDRSATGYLPREEFEKTADRFFAEPETSVRGWETARSAQSRVWHALIQIAETSENALIVAHGGVGALTMARLLDEPISRRFDQPVVGGGAAFTFTMSPPRLIEGWQSIDG